MSFLTVRGMQESGLITCAKHYMLYEQEPVCTGPLDDSGSRTDCQDVSSDVDGKSTHDQGVDRAHGQIRRSKSFICPASQRRYEQEPGRSCGELLPSSLTALIKLTSSSYNKINGTASCQSDASMNKILKGELNFQGL
jgi:beta-glucosidase